jgi:hypothetical protein
VPAPESEDLLILVLACGVCRTDLHVVDGELPNPLIPVVPGHEIVGRVVCRPASKEGIMGTIPSLPVAVLVLSGSAGLVPQVPGTPGPSFATGQILEDASAIRDLLRTAGLEHLADSSAVHHAIQERAGRAVVISP